MIDLDKITAFDVETKGKGATYALQPFRLIHGDAWLTTCAVAYTGEPGDELGIATEALVRPTPQQLADWLDSVIEADHYVVCWNAPFDVAWLIAMHEVSPELGLLDKVMRVRWLDGLLINRHRYNAPKYRPEGRMSMSLKPAVRQRLPQYGDYADDIDFNDESPENIEKLLLYNQRDSRFTLHITREVLQELDPEVVRNILIEARSIPLVAQSTVEGLYADRAQAIKVGKDMEDQRKTALVRLLMSQSDLPPEFVADPDTFLNSPKKLGDLLFRQWGLPVVKLTDAGGNSTDKEALLTLAVQDPRAALLHQYREGTYLKTKFSDGIIESLDYNGDERTRPGARIFGTYTGRMTYSSKTGKEEAPTGCAIHQWKRDAEFRKIIIPPPGYDLIELDFAGQEFRWMAVESGDPVMLGLCEPGEDAHAYMAGRCTGLQYEWIRDEAAEGNKEAKAKRQLGKVANLSLQYRTSPATLVRVAAIQHKVSLTHLEAKAIHATYLTTYLGVRRYWQRQVRFARANHYVRTLAGRRVYLGDPASWSKIEVTKKGATTYEDWTWGHESTAINFPIQGIGGDQKYLALLVARNYLPTVGGRFYMELHDGLFFVVPKDKSQKAGRELRHILSNLPYKRAWGVDLPIKFPVDLKIGPSWGELVEIHD